MSYDLDQVSRARLADLDAEARFSVKPPNRTVLGRRHRCEVIDAAGKVLAASDSQSEYMGLILALGRAEADRDHPHPALDDDGARDLRRLKKELKAVHVAAESERT